MTPEAVIMESMFRVVNKDKEVVDFKLNSAQRKLDESLTGRDIVPKARQEGVSTYFLGRYTASCLMHRNIRAAVVAHEGRATEKLLSRCKFFLDNIKGPPPVIGRSGIGIITFPKMNSEIYIGTAGARAFGRGDTITHLLCSEYAYWEKPKEMLSGLLQAVPTAGEIAIESTGNGQGNDYHRRAMRAFNKQSIWTCHFLDWQSFDEYKVSLTPHQREQVLSKLREEWEEPKLVGDYGLTAEQIIWRRIKLEELDYDLSEFKKEYPMSIDECFQSSKRGIFHKVNYVPTTQWVDQGNGWRVLGNHPYPDLDYLVGVDSAGGIGDDGDNSVIEVAAIIEKDDGSVLIEQVAEYASNRIEPDVLGIKVAETSAHYNDAYTIIENNNHGPVTIKGALDEGLPEYLLYSMETAGTDFEDRSLMQLGFRTQKRTKPILVSRLRTMLASNMVIHSESLKDELSTFIEHEDGALAAADGCKDDRVVAMALVTMGVNQAVLISSHAKQTGQTKSKDPFSFENILDEMKGRHKKHLYAKQLESMIQN